MSVLIKRVGPISVTVRYLWQKTPTSPYYYRRRIPKELAQALGQVMSVKALRTRDKLVAAKQILVLARLDDELWHRMRNGMSPDDSREKAVALLARYDLEDKPRVEQEDKEFNIDFFLDIIRDKAPGDEQPAPYLSTTELRALAILGDREEYTLSDAKRLYLKKRGGLEPTAINRKLRNTVNSAFAPVFDLLGDREITKYKRVDVSSLIDAGLAKGLKTATLKKQLGVVRAGVNDLIKEYELHGVHNPFKEFEIPNLLEDAAEKASLDSVQIDRVRSFVASKNTPTTNIIGMLLDTGSRLSEVLGLKLDDVKLDVEVPHIIIHKNTFRRLKSKASIRKIPLVGDALFSAQRAVSEVTSGFVFERYIDNDSGLVKNETASKALAKALKKLDCYTCHHMRHTMRTRLRNADVPAIRAEEIQGWSRVSIADQYGEQTALKNLQSDLLKTH